MEDLLYEYTITYRPEGDTRDVSACPAVQCSAASPEARCAHAAKDIESLSAQGYTILAFATRDNCGMCLGRGKVMCKPKGWRKKHNPPAWMMVGLKCPRCQGDGLLKT